MHNISMYNSYLAHQRESRLQEMASKQLEQSKWRQRYQKEVQPQLLTHYQKRLNSFIHQMQETPTIIHTEEDETVRKDRTHLHFTFKTVEDWKSIKTPLERLELKQHEKIMKTRDQPQKTLNLSRRFFSSSPATTIQKRNIEFRSRQKIKEIHPPMKYSNMNKLKEKPLQPLRKKRFSLQDRANHSQLQGKISNSNSIARDQSLTITHVSHKSEDIEDVDFHFTRDKSDSIEVEARKYEKEKIFVEKKLHFKKLMDLSLKEKNEIGKKTIKQILHKCGIFKKKRDRAGTQIFQIDNFSTQFQTIVHK